MTCKAKQENNGVCPHHNLQCGWPKCNELEQEPVAWVPYLSDRADGVKGHYAIARWNPRGYREVWNLRRHEWGAYSDDVLSLEEADTLLRLITIPTRKVTSPQPQQRKPLTDEQIVAINDKHYNIAYRDFDADIAIARAIEAAHGIKE
jgi:hypothetical protein